VGDHQALPDELRERVLRLNADVVRDDLRPGDAVWLACDLLVAGIDSSAIVDLAGEPPTRLELSEALPMVHRMLADLGIEPVDTSQAPWIVARGVARQLITGDLPAVTGASELWSLWESCDHPEELGRMLQPLEDWETTPVMFRDDEAIRARILQLAPAVVGAADAYLAGTKRPLW
jgi:hypothetical protein